jgi:hypothetical protein
MVYEVMDRLIEDFYIRNFVEIELIRVLESVTEGHNVQKVFLYTYVYTAKR